MYGWLMAAFGRLLPIATGSNGAVSASASLPPAVQVECKRVVSINAIAWSDECNFAAVAIVPERTIGGLSLTRILDASGHVTRSAQSHPHG